MMKFRNICIILFATLCSSINAQSVKLNKDMLCQVLEKAHTCKVEIKDICDKDGVTIITWAYRQGYTSNPLSYKGKCLYIKYYIEHDSNGSSFYRELYIPYTIVNKKNLEKSDVVYYQDRWGGKGIRFDSQGGRLEVNNTIKGILKCVQ